MAKNINTPVSPKTTPVASSTPVAKTTVARNSPVPRAEPMKREISHEMIAKKAYEIFVSGKSGSQMENWLRAERELKGM